MRNSLTLLNSPPFNSPPLNSPPLNSPPLHSPQLNSPPSDSPSLDSPPLAAPLVFHQRSRSTELSETRKRCAALLREAEDTREANRLADALEREALTKQLRDEALLESQRRATRIEQELLDYKSALWEQFRTETLNAAKLLAEEILLVELATNGESLRRRLESLASHLTGRPTVSISSESLSLLNLPEHSFTFRVDNTIPTGEFRLQVPGGELRSQPHRELEELVELIQRGDA